MYKYYINSQVYQIDMYLFVLPQKIRENDVWIYTGKMFCIAIFCRKNKIKYYVIYYRLINEIFFIKILKKILKLKLR